MTSNCDFEERQIAAGRGKWSEPGVPNRGWTCVEIEDLKEPAATCEMCESQIIRYAHFMEHPDYADVLAVGCVCAGHMEGDLAWARTREAGLNSRAARRRRWTARRWRVSVKGNPTIRADGYRATVYPKGSGWGATVASADGGIVRHSRREFTSVDEAKLAAFDEITRLLAAPAASSK